jgi:hypothetical protein
MDSDEWEFVGPAKIISKIKDYRWIENVTSSFAWCENSCTSGQWVPLEIEPESVNLSDATQLENAVVLRMKENPTKVAMPWSENVQPGEIGNLTMIFVSESGFFGVFPIYISVNSYILTAAFQDANGDSKQFIYAWEAGEYNGAVIENQGWYRVETVDETVTLTAITAAEIDTFSARILIKNAQLPHGIASNFLEQFGREYAAGLYANGYTWRFVGPVDVGKPQNRILDLLSEKVNTADFEKLETKVAGLPTKIPFAETKNIHLSQVVLVPTLYPDIKYLATVSDPVNGWTTPIRFSGNGDFWLVMEPMVNVPTFIVTQNGNNIQLPDGFTWEAHKRYDIRVSDGYATITSWTVN